MRRMDPAEHEAIRRWVEQWRIAGPMLEQIKTQALRAMTEEEGRLAAERVMEAVPLPRLEPETATSGLVEQQRWFSKARGC